MELRRRRLLWHGMFLFVLGLVTGLMEAKFANPRMGLAAHLEGVMNGTFLVALGAIWLEVRLSARLQVAVFWGALYATYGNWTVTVLAAVFGSAAMTPLTSVGHIGQPWQETFVTVGFVSVGLVLLSTCVAILVGLRGSARVATAGA